VTNGLADVDLIWLYAPSVEGFSDANTANPLAI
jgi:hypothetical protein